MKKKTNAERLRELMKSRELTRPAVAELAGVSVKTVDSWLAAEGAASHRPMPGRAIELVELKLAKNNRTKGK